MIHHLYGIFDQKANCLVNTFMSLSDAAAERTFKGLLTTVEDSVFTGTPSDFNLIKIIEIDDQHLPDESSVVAFGNQYSKDLLHSERIQNAERRAEIETAYSEKRYNNFKEILKNEN